MKNPLIAIALAATVGSAVALTALPAAAATCDEMFNKAEHMVSLKTNLGVDRKMNAYKLAMDSYTTCSNASAMTDGSQRMAMMKDAEKKFAKTYSYILSVE
jgi:hypothetical protein